MSIDARLNDPLMLSSGGPEFVRMREWATAGQRLKLARWWGRPSDPKTWLPWIMLNPSTADGMKNDPTLSRIIHFTWMWGFDGLWVFNVFPFRTPSTRELAGIVLDWDKRSDWGVRDAIWDNHDAVARTLRPFDAVMVAWGAPSGALAFETEMWVEQLFDRINDPESDRERTLATWCLGTTKGGDPIHPMARGHHRVPNEARPIRFENPGTIGLGEAA